MKNLSISILTIIYVLVFLTGCGGGGSSDDGYGMSNTGTSSTNTGTGYGSGTTTDSGTTGDTSTDSSDTTTEYSWQIETQGLQQVPRLSVEQTIMVSMALDASSGTVTASFDPSDIAGYSMAHLHAGSVGQNGPVLLNFSLDDYGKATIDGLAVDSATIDLIKSGQTYVNIHTDMYSTGKFRGQVVDSETKLFFFNLDGGQEVPATDSDGTGFGYASYHPEHGFVVKITLNNITNITGVHVHEGIVGTNGDAVVMMEQDPDNSSGWRTPPDAIISAQTVTALLNAGLHVNVHTGEFPNGAIRGQIVTISN